MSEPLAPRAVLERIDGWSDASIENLGGGLTNRTYLVTAGTRRCVLKIDLEPRVEPFNSRKDEAKIQRNANEAGLAPAVLYSDRQCYLTEYVDGAVLSPETLRSHDTLQRLGRGLRKLHALPRSGRTFDAGHAARIYADRIDDPNQSEVRKRLDIIDSVPVPAAPCLCHNDLVAENIIDTGELKFLDWEYACDNNPLFDLATVVAHHDLDDAQTHCLLRAYFNGEWRTRRPELERQISNYKALLWLWKAARE